MRGGNGNNTNLPTKTDRYYGAAFITVGKEVSLRRENGLIRGMGKTIFVRPYH